MSRRPTGRSWPFAWALVLFVLFLGALPHVRFSLLLGRASYFLSAYDEDTYAFWALAGGGPLLPHRFVSDAALVLLTRIFGGSWSLALVAADLLFPAACAVLAWVLVGRITSRRLPRLCLALCLLFAQELLSLGCWTIWQVPNPLSLPAPDVAVYDLRSLRAAMPESLQRLWPDYASPFLTLFRTPEPQISRVLFLAALLLALRLAAADERDEKRAPLVVFGPALLLNAVLGLTYFFQAVAIAGVEATFAFALAVLGHARAARRVSALAAVGFASVTLGVFAYNAGADAQPWAFASRLPVITPSSLGAVVGFVLAFAERRRGRQDALLALAAACFATILVATNQQLLTGRMVSTRDWERSVDYPLLVIGVSILAVRLARRRAISEHAIYAASGAFVLAAAYGLFGAQQRLFQENYLARNLESVALERAVEEVEARGVRPSVWILQKPDLSLLLQLRLQREIPHLVEAADVLSSPIPPMSKPQAAWGTRSRFARGLFEYFARASKTPAAVQRLLSGEADGGSGAFLTFLFALDEWWPAMTDGRATRSAAVRAQLPAVRDAYARYLAAGDPCWSRPAVVLTRENVAQRRGERWSEEFLVEVTVGPKDAPLMNMHAFLQLPRPEVGPAAGAGECN